MGETSCQMRINATTFLDTHTHTHTLVSLSDGTTGQRHCSHNCLRGVEIFRTDCYQKLQGTHCLELHARLKREKISSEMIR